MVRLLAAIFFDFATQPIVYGPAVRGKLAGLASGIRIGHNPAIDGGRICGGELSPLDQASHEPEVTRCPST